MNMRIQRKHLRRQAITNTLFPPKTLRQAITHLGFVQADPIRSPARAQDLILRHRVRDYRAGDLEQRYRSLHLEEDYLYAYGFMPESTWHLLHPRSDSKLTRLEKQVLEIVSAHRQIHPRDLESYLGKRREVNAWGGYSKATTRALHALHYRGLLRVAGRENGIRLYEPTRKERYPLDPDERLQSLILLVARILAPVPERSLSAALRLVVHYAPGFTIRKPAVAELLQSGRLEAATVDDIRYLWPVPRVARKQPGDFVRFLAPFDPLVWDRSRFEHLWDWAYRFEAYTPLAKRKLGYYAMPLLWREDVVGWVNISLRGDEFNVEAGFNDRKPTEPEFEPAWEAEVESFRNFLRKRAGTG